MAYISLHKANSNHRTRNADGSMASRYSRYEIGVIDGQHREIMAVIADQAGFDGMGFDASIGSGDDNWHVANVFTSDRRYVDTIVIGGADDAEHAAAVAQTQLDHLGGDNCVVLANPQFDSLTGDKPNTWSLNSIEKLLSNPSQNKTFLPVITAQELNVEAARVTFDTVQWDSMDGLVSHKGNDSALYLDMVRADGHNQLLEPLNLVHELGLLGAEETSFDALMDTKNRLSLMKDRLFNAMSRSGDSDLSVTNVTETKPFKRQGVTNIAFVFDLSDGQKLSIWFHNPDSTPSKLMPSDIMISWKWMLNKRDVTAILSPKQGDNVQIPVLAARIMRVARKNSKKFAATQARAAELEKELQDAQTLVEVKQGEIDQLDTDISGLNAAIDAAMAKKAEEPTTPPEATAKEQKEQRERERVLAMQFDEVTQFYKNNGAEPSAYANDIIEKMLAKRLESIRANAEFVEYLAPYDTYNLLSAEPESDAPIVITGQEIEVGEEVDFKTAKNNAMAYFDKNLKDKTVFCQAIDSDVLLRRRGGKHIAKANNTFREKLKLVAAIPEMIKQGKYGHYTALNKEKGSNIAGYYVLNVEVKVGDVLRAARVVLEKNNEGEVLYDIGINKKEALAALGDTTSSIMLDGFTESSQYQGLLDESYQVNDNEVNQFDKLTTDNTVILNLFFDADADADADADVINNKAIIEGRINESTTVNGTKVVSNFALVEAKELITSHDALGVANPDFPQELQPRDRSDKKSVDAIKLNAKNLQPEKLGDTEYAGNGAPIIGDDFLVESGNGRAIAIKSAYDNGDAGKYKEWLVNNATDFGLSADDVNGYNQPVLVRVRKTEIDRVEFAIEANLDANPSPLDDADAQATEPEAVEEPADTAPSKTVAIRDALDVLKNDVFKGQTDKVLMYTLNDAGDVVHRSFIKASSKSAQTRFTNKHLYEAGVKTVVTANIPDNNQAAARQLETLGYTIDYSDPEGFTSDDYTVGDVYEMKRKDVFGNSTVAPDDAIIMEFREWGGLRVGADAATLRLTSLTGASTVNLTVAEMDAIVSRGDARRLMQPEIDAARDFEDEKLISTYVNNKGRVLAEVFLQNGVYDINSSDGSSISLADVGQVTEKLKAIKSRNASMKHQSGQDFLRDDGGKTYPPVEYDEEEREYIAYMNNKKVDKWTAYQVSGGNWAVVADNAQSRAFNSWNPKYFDTVDQLLAAYPAFKGIKALIAQAEQDDYESIDSSKYPEMFLTRHADKLQTLGVTDNDIQYRHDDTSDKLYVEEGIFKDKTLNYTDAVCNVVDAAISLYADAAVSDFNATAYQDSLFDSLTSQSKPTYGVTVQIVKFDATVRAKIDIDGDCEILQGASGEDVVATIKHKFIDNQAAYIDAIESAFKAQSDKKAADDAAAAQADIDTKEAENMKNTNSKSSNLSTAELRALAELGTVNYNFKDTTLESGEINDVDKRKIAYEFMDVLENNYGFSVGYKGRDFETIHISQMGFKTTIQTSFIVPFNQQDIDDIVNAYREYKKEQAAAGQKEWWETTRASTSVYLIGNTLNDDYVRIKNRDGQIANNGDAFTYDFSVLIKGQGFEYGEDGSLAEIQAFVKEKTKDKGELRLVKGADVLAMNPQADDNDLTNAPASDDNSDLSKQLADFEATVNAADFNPANFDNDAFMALIDAADGNDALSARIDAIGSRYEQELIKVSLAALTSLTGGA